MMEQLLRVLDADNLTNSSKITACAGSAQGALLITTIVVAVVILVVLSFTQRRVNSLKCCLRPGIVIPVNLLTTSPHRLIYVAIFGAMSADVLSIALHFDDFIAFTHNAYLDIFIAAILSPIVLVLYLSIKYFPVFAGVSSPIPPVGHLLGLLYSCLLFAYNAYGDWVQLYCKFSTNSLDKDNDVYLGLEVGSRVPVYAFSAIILVWYIVQVLRDMIVAYRKGLQEACLPAKEGHQYHDRYVRCLLRRRNPGEHTGFITRCLRYFFPYGLSPLRLPLKFLVALVIMVVIMYQLTLVFVGLGIFTGHKIVQHWKKNETKEDFKEIFRLLNVSEGHYGDVLSSLTGFAVVLPGAPMISFIFCFVLLVHMAACIFENLRKTIKGDFSFLSRNFSPGAFTVTASWRYAGYQVAFFISAYFIYTIVLWSLGGLGIAAYLGFKFFKHQMFLGLTFILVFPSWTLLVLLSQVVVCRLVFLKKGGGKFATITNMRLFHWATYVLFFYGVILGVVSSILRMLTSLVLSLLLLIRLDRVVLMRGFEILDFGHKTYVGFLYLEYTYNNPVVNVFVKQLVKNTFTTDWGAPPLPRHRSEASESDPEASFPILKSETQINDKSSYGAAITHSLTGPSSVKSQRALNRWLVAYTLLRNPSLQGLTASRLQGGRRESSQYLSNGVM